MALAWFVIFLLALGGFGLWLLQHSKASTRNARKTRGKATRAHRAALPEADQEAYQISYAPPQFEWSGNSLGSLPVKTLTYKQYECLEDARYGFTIVGLPPSARQQALPHKTRGHSLKTVDSLSRHGFLTGDAREGYVITDLGLHALEVCSVRY